MAENEGFLSKIAQMLGKAGKDKPRDGSEGPPRPELGQRGVTGDARFAPQIIDRRYDKGQKQWVLAHRLDRVAYRDYDRVRFYPTVKDALTAIRLPLERANFHFECANQAAADLAMQELGPHIRYLVGKLAKGGLEFGRQTAEKVWELKTNVKVSGSQSGTGNIETFYPFVWSIKRFAYFSPEDTEILIWPRTGEFAGIRQYVGSFRDSDTDIAATKLIHYIHDSEFDSNYGTPRTKPAIPFVDLAQGVYDDASLYFARFACPTLIGYAPAVKRETGVDANGQPVLQDSLKWMVQTLSGIRNAHAVVFPDERDQNGNPKWSVQPLELGERGLFVEYALHLNTMIGASLCVPQMALSTVPSSGTYNLGQTQIDLFTQNEEALLDSIKDVINEQLVDDFRVFNFGHDCPPLRVVFEPVSTDVSQMMLQGLVQNLVMGAPLFTADGQQIVPDWAKLASDKGVPVILQPAGMMPGMMPGMVDPNTGMPMGMMPGTGAGMGAGMPDMTAMGPGSSEGGEGTELQGQGRDAGAKGTGKPGSKGDMVGQTDKHTYMNAMAQMSEAASYAQMALEGLEEGKEE